MSKATHNEQRITPCPILETLLVILAPVNTGLKFSNNFAAGEVDAPRAGPSRKRWFKLM